MRVLLFSILLPVSVDAGAWARGEGQTYAALGIEAAEAGIAATLFAERGMSEKITIGLDGFVDEENESLTATAFARYTFDTKGPNVWAVSVGLGGEYRVDERLLQLTAGGPMFTADHRRAGGFLRLGGHYGRGLENGWFAADASYALGRLKSQDDPPLPDEDIARAKIDITYGRRFSEPITAIGQLFLEDYDGDDAASVQVGVTYDFSEVTMGAALRQGSDGDTVLTIGASRRF